METKNLMLINKAYDSLYDLESKVNIRYESVPMIQSTKKIMEEIETYMDSKGYKMKINNRDKCVFILKEVN